MKINNKIWIAVGIIALALFVLNPAKKEASALPIGASSNFLDLLDMDLSQLSTQVYGGNDAVYFSVRVTGTTTSMDRGNNQLDAQIYHDGSELSPGAGKNLYLLVAPYSFNGTPQYNLSINAGETINLKFINDNNILVYLPELKGNIRDYQGLTHVKLYLAQDGSTYWDEALTNLAMGSGSIQLRDYSFFISEKNKYIGGGTFMEFVSKANEWITAQ